jgi:O-antigen ligase
MHLAARRRARARPPSSPAVWGKRLACVVALVWIAGVAIGFEQALSVLMFVGFAAAIAGIRYPALGLFGIGLLTVLDPIARHMVLDSGGLLRWNSFNYLLLLASLLFLPRVWRLSDPHSRVLRLLILVLAVDLLMAPRWENGIQNLLNISTVFAIVIYFQRSPRDNETMYWLGVIMGLAAAIGGLEFYRHPELLTVMNKNAFAMFPLAGVFGACVAFPFAASIRGGQLLLASLAAVDVTWVFLSRSRGALIIALLAMAFLLVAARTLTTRVIYLVAAALLVVGLAGKFGSLEATATARFGKMLNSDTSLEERTSGRTNLMRGGWQIFLAHPLGVGTGAFEDAWATLEQPETTNRWAAGKFVPAHSAWVMVLAENGLPGILLFAAYVASFAFVALGHRNPHLILLGIFVTAMLAIAFTANEFQGKALWFAAAAATALLHPDTDTARRRARVIRLTRRMRPLVAEPVPGPLALARDRDPEPEPEPEAVR